MKTKQTFIALCLAACLHASGQPVIITQPEGVSVSLGIDVVFSVTAVSPLPISYQWQKGGNDLPEETSDILVFADVQVTDGGSYTVVVSDSSGSVTSLVATLTVDGAFSKIITGDIVNDGGASSSAAWADYDNDGWLDLFVANVSAQNDFLYHNNGDGTFTRTSTDVVGNDRADSRRAAWGDYDNDGNLDLFVSLIGNDLLYHNNGDGTFTRITDGIVVNDGGTSAGPSWADYDNDGDLDLYVSNNPGPKALYQNNGDGTFTKVTDGILVTDLPGDSAGNSWGDYDNDGDLDLFICTPNGNNVLYRNDGVGAFTKITTGILVNEGGLGFGCTWGDYDNDGWLDLFVANGGIAGSANSFLYHNNGDGTFTKVTSSPIVTESGSSFRGVWGDYDNDSFLDLFVADYAGNNKLFHNNGDGTFTKITIGSVVNDGGQSFSCTWGDYNNDGFLDLFVANGASLGNENNFLYRGNDNGNSWIKVKLFGGASNRYGVGAKVKVNAVIGGADRWLTRSIDGGDASGNASALIIGLGDATLISTLHIEWPSGVIQELHDVTVNQSLTVLEATDGPPVFFTQPRSQTVLPGSNVTLRALVASVGPVSYLWSKDDEAIAGATTNSLTLSNVQWADTGTYTLTASNTFGMTTSQTAVLTVAAVVITRQPLSQYIRPGNPVTFAVSARSDSPITYQWLFNGENIEGATGETFTIANMQIIHQGNYAVRVDNSIGSVVSDAAVLTALLEPNFVQQPMSLTVVAGDTATFTVALDGTPPFGYRWRRNNLTIVPFGEGTATLTISNVPLAYHGSRIDVVATNLANLLPGVPSSRALLFVLADTDGDHLPDVWETAHNLNPNDPNDAALDSDGDGMTNLQEYAAGTDPSKTQDYLKIDGINLINGAEEVAIRFMAVSNKTYTIQYRDSVDSGAWQRLVDVPTAANNRVVETVDLASGNTRRIYRLITPRSP